MSSTAFQGDDLKYYPVVEIGGRRYVSPRGFDDFNDASGWAYNRFVAALDKADEVFGGWNRER